jgi:hypothetical protein
MAVSVEKVQFEISAQDQATRVFKSLSGTMGDLKSQYVGLLSATVGGAVFTKFIADAISTRSELKKLSDITGDSVQTLDGLRRVARVAGVDMGELGGSLQKLAKNLNSADDDGKAAGEAIKALGIDIESVRAKKPGEAMLEIALALNKFEDGASKVAVAMALMGKGGAAMLPMLKDMAEQGELNGKITNEQARAADELDKNMRRLSAAFSAGKNALAGELIPWLAQMSEEMVQGIRITGSLANALMTLGTINPLRGVRENIVSLQNDIEARNSGKGLMAGMPGYGGAIANIDRDNARDQQRIEFLKFQQRQEALRLAGGDASFDANDLRARAKPRLDFTIPKIDRGGAGGEKVSAFDTLKRQMEDQLAKVGELTEYEKLLGLLQTERYKNLTEAQKQELYLLAGKLEISKEDAKLAKETEQVVEQAAKESARRQLQEAERLNQLRDKYADLADPLEKYRKELEEIAKLSEIGYLTAEQAATATKTIYETMYPEMKKAHTELDKGKDLWKDFGVAATSSLEKVVLEGGKARDVVRALLKDMVSIYFRTQVANPGMNALMGLFGLGGGTARETLVENTGGIAATNLSMDSFRAEGGPVSAGTPYIVGEKGPELFMPSGSGSIVPNSQLGGGVSIVQNMSFGSDVNRSTLVEWGRQVKRETVAAVADARLRGGSFSGAMGR